MSDPVAADVQTISAYLKSREGKRWRNQDTRQILAKAAEFDQLLERLLESAGFVCDKT